MSETEASEPARSPPDRRKLVAVVYADMAGYSRLIGLDDVGTLERLRALRKNLIDPAIGEHGGKIVQTGGDSLLIVFDSIDGAVRCAVKVQKLVPIQDGDQPLDRAMRFRIGINIGDAIADGTDLHGDAVNVAARLQAECPTGAICVSKSVRDHVHGRQDLAFEELGALRLKNIERPVEAFLVRQSRDAASPKAMLDPLYDGLTLNLGQLRVFYRVSKLGSISAAADELGFTPASVTRQLHEFEQRAGVSLLHTSRTGVSLTDAGQLAFRHAEQIFNQADELRSILQNLPTANTGKLTVGGSLTAGEFFLPDVARRFREQYPEVVLSVVVENSSAVLKRVRQAEFDLGFIGTDVISDELTAIPCWEDELVVIAPPNSSLRLQGPEVIRSQVFVMREEGSATRQHIEQYLRRHGLTARTAMTAGSPEAVKRYVAAGVGWGFASRHSIATEIESNRLIVVPIDGWMCRRVFYAIHRCSHRLTASQVAFIDLAKTVMA